MALEDELAEELDAEEQPLSDADAAACNVWRRNNLNKNGNKTPASASGSALALALALALAFTFCFGARISG